MAWLKKRDTAERVAWASQFHNGNEPLGEVVKSVMEKRGACWDKPIQNMVAPPNPACQPQQPRASQDSVKQAQGQQQPPSSPIRRETMSETRLQAWIRLSIQARQGGTPKQERRADMEPSSELVSHSPKQPQHPPPQRDPLHINRQLKERGEELQTFKEKSWFAFSQRQPGKGTEVETDEE